MNPVKIVIFGLAAYLGYEWLQKSGLWAQYLGGVSTAPQPAQQPNANPSSPAPPSTGTTQTQVPQPAVDQNLANQLTAMMQSSQGRVLGTVSEWNWLYTHLKNDPNASIITDDAGYAGAPVTAIQYLQARGKEGLSGIGWFQGSFVQRPLRAGWVN